MDYDSVKRASYILIAAIAGAITSLSLTNYRSKTRAEILMTVFVGTAFALFFMPWITIDVLKVNNDSLRTACGLTYLGGTIANAILPAIIKKVRTKYGLEEDKSA